MGRPRRIYLFTFLNLLITSHPCVCCYIQIPKAKCFLNRSILFDSSFLMFKSMHWALSYGDSLLSNHFTCGSHDCLTGNTLHDKRGSWPLLWQSTLSSSSRTQRGCLCFLLWPIPERWALIVSRVVATMASSHLRVSLTPQKFLPFSSHECFRVVSKVRLFLPLGCGLALLTWES